MAFFVFERRGAGRAQRGRGPARSEHSEHRGGQPGRMSKTSSCYGLIAVERPRMFHVKQVSSEARVSGGVDTPHGRPSSLSLSLSQRRRRRTGAHARAERAAGGAGRRRLSGARAPARARVESSSSWVGRSVGALRFHVKPLSREEGRTV